MKSINVILLDTSSSMSGGFEGSHSPRNDVEYVEAATKIAAAKKWLLKELDGLPNTDVVLISFDTEARVVERAAPGRTEAIRARIQDVVARGLSTNIAA